MLIETKTTATDMVTEMDTAVEAYLVEQLLAARPDDGTVGEEGADSPGTSGVRWVIDPIDGTTNFVYGMPGFNISVAAEVDGEIVAGAVVDPLHHEVFCAALKCGATRNGIPIRCNDTSDVAMALVGTGFSYESDRRRAQAQVLPHLLPAVRDIRRIGAAAVDLCWVACGRFDAFYEKSLRNWDYAAGALIASGGGRHGRRPRRQPHLRRRSPLAATAGAVRAAGGCCSRRDAWSAPPPERRPGPAIRATWRPGRGRTPVPLGPWEPAS